MGDPVLGQFSPTPNDTQRGKSLVGRGEDFVGSQVLYTGRIIGRSMKSCPGYSQARNNGCRSIPLGMTPQSREVLVQAGKAEKIGIGFFWRHPPLKHHPTRAPTVSK